MLSRVYVTSICIEIELLTLSEAHQLHQRRHIYQADT